MPTVNPDPFHLFSDGAQAKIEINIIPASERFIRYFKILSCQMQ